MSKQEEIKQALEAATPGPWKVYRSKLGRHEETLIGTEYDHPQLKAPDSIVGHAFGIGVEYTYIREADANLIAKSPEYIAYLLEYNERLQNALVNAIKLMDKKFYGMAHKNIVEALGQEGEGNQDE